LRQEFAAQYGAKVECQFLAWGAGQREVAMRTASLFRTGQGNFDDEAARHPPRSRVITINRRGTPGPAELEQAAFALKPGEVSRVIEATSGFFVLKCLRRIPADKKRFEDVRESLKRDLEQRFKDEDTMKLFKDLKAEARIKLLWTPPDDRE